jgi:hypothetical protein
MSMINGARTPVAVATVAIVGMALLSFSSSSSPAATTRQPFSRYTVTEEGVRLSFRIPETSPAGSSWARLSSYWETFSSIPAVKSPGGPISLNRSIADGQGAEAIIYWTSFPDGDYAEPCSRLLKRSIGRSAAKLAAAVAGAPGTKLVEGPSNVTLGGYPAKHVVVSVRRKVGCDPGFFYSWREVRGGALWDTTRAGDTIRVWIVKVDSRLLFIGAATTRQATAWLTKEVQQIVESIRFG